MLDRVTITGADDSIEPYQLWELSDHFPFLEWGLLLASEDRFGTPRFPSESWWKTLGQEVIRRQHTTDLRCALHLCGDPLAALLAGDIAAAEERIPAVAAQLCRRWQFNTHGQPTDVAYEDLVACLTSYLPLTQIIQQVDGGMGHKVWPLADVTIPGPPGRWGVPALLRVRWGARSRQPDDGASEDRQRRVRWQLLDRHGDQGPGRRQVRPGDCASVPRTLRGRDGVGDAMSRHQYRTPESTYGMVEVKIRTGNLKYLDDLLRLKCGPDLVSLDVFPNVKEVSESFGAFDAVRREMADRLGDDRIHCIVIGDGNTPRTAVTLAYRSRWTVHAIDPRMKMGRLRTTTDNPAVHRVHRYQMRLEEFLGRYRVGALGNMEMVSAPKVVVAVHSHADLKLAAELNPILTVAIPCCVTQDWAVPPTKSYDDWSILSPKRRVLVWRKPVVEEMVDQGLVVPS